MSHEGDIWKRIASTVATATENALSGPVTPDHILTPEKLALEEVLCGGHMSGFTITASLNIIRHERAIEQFGNPYGDQPKPSAM